MLRIRSRTIAGGATVLAVILSPTVATAAPAPIDNFAGVPGRTSISFVHSPTGLRVGTANQGEGRPALSVSKLYLVDHALRHGDGSAADRALSERAIRYSDDGAAEQLAGKYPGAIAATAAEYGLTATGGGYWGSSSTSTADIVTFLEAKKRTDPASPMFVWMGDAAPVAADGTSQDWGTSTLPGAVGSKWGWSDFGQSSVASASFGTDFSVAAQTYGGPAEQTADVQGAFGPERAPVAPPPPPLLNDPGLRALLDSLATALPLPR
jgi:hypothetical protein